MSTKFSSRTNRPSASRAAKKRDKGLRLELLELRSLLSACSVLDSLTAEPTFNQLAVTNPTPVGYTPAQVRTGYGISQVTFNGGAVAGNGSGQTIAIVDAYDDPNIASDLQVFDQTMGIANLPTFTFTKLSQNGGTSMPTADSGWSLEIALDVEWAHAMAPGASIVLVEANSSSLTDLLNAVDTVRNLKTVSVVSMSWGANEFAGETQYDSHFTTPAGHIGVTFTASAGDGGAGAIWPAASPNVVSVGGTALSLSGSTYAGESAWNGSGGGYSSVESEPSYQSSVQSSGRRSVPDVAYDASPSTGVAVYDSLATGGKSGWFQIGGTSVGAPQWAALLAIADQGRALTGQGTLSSGQALYKLPSTDFHDVTTGSNGNPAKAGYDLVTGRGSPVANSLIPDLVNNVSVTQTPVAPTPPPAPPSRHHFSFAFIGNRYFVVDGSSNTPVDNTDAQLANEGLDGVLTTLTRATTASTNTVATAGTVPQQTAFAPQTALAMSPSMNGPLVVAPGLGLSLGNLAFAPVEEPSAPEAGPNVEQDEPTDGANRGGASAEAADAAQAIEGRPRETSQAPDVRSSGEARPQSIVPQAGTPQTNSDQIGLQATVALLETTVDACIADEAWIASADGFLGDMPLRAAESCDLDWVAAAIGVAVTANLGRRESATSSRAVRPEVQQPRRQICRLVRD
jgi:hypothetical protein